MSESSHVKMKLSRTASNIVLLSPQWQPPVFSLSLNCLSITIMSHLILEMRNRREMREMWASYLTQLGTKYYDKTSISL